MGLEKLKKNPYLSLGVPKLTRPGPMPNPKRLLVVNKRREKRKNPKFEILSFTATTALGAGAGYLVDQYALAIAPKWVGWSVCGLSGVLGVALPRLGPAMGGAMWYGVLSRQLKSLIP